MTCEVPAPDQVRLPERVLAMIRNDVTEPPDDRAAGAVLIDLTD
ncbi:hypothetical protein [Streptomyces sp. NBC_01190]|nr:hypothetical protein OG519_00020 [Streptomyces sp. NBC_01190]WSS24148.1 hypothetical protein OG519_34030 [Streptomyces sp. NBC_01190]